MSDEKRSEDELQEKNDAPLDADADVAGAETAAGADGTKADGGEAQASEEADGDASADANPAAIARRIAALGGDDDSEALAQEEERKLAQRRSAKKKVKKKSGLEVAASKKLSSLGTRAEPRRRIAVAADADPLIERTAKLSDWVKKNQKLVQIVGVGLFVGLLGLAGYLYYDGKRETEASMGLTEAVETQRARIGEPKKTDDDQQRYYKTFEDRRAAALTQYQQVQAKFPGTGAAILARLAEGSLLLDKRDADGALAAFTDVSGSPLAAADTEVKGRALEGIGFAHELKAVAAPDEKDKHLDAALATFKDLESSVDVKGFKELAMYHQARVLMDKGDKDKAKELLLSLKQRFDRVEDPIAVGLPVPPSFPYLREVALDRLREIDPMAAPKPTMPSSGGMNLTPEQIQKMMENLNSPQGGR